MSITAGTRIGAYEVSGLLGSGGMGDVYRARHTRLNREVALKVLPDAFAADADRLGRLEREATILASLNHANIAQLYGIKELCGRPVLAMELVEGPTLADRIARAPLPLAEAVPVAIQIAQALEAAHERTIVHRDLKPANIKLRSDGTIKVLDFGLAKTTESAATDVGAASMSPTLSVHATQAGVLLGTAPYMSPGERGRSTIPPRDTRRGRCVTDNPHPELERRAADGTVTAVPVRHATNGPRISLTYLTARRGAGCEGGS